jgi:TPP-dependent 2-oxoacid decarboxylase
MIRTTIGQYLISRLQELGIRHVFGVPGDYVLGFYDLLTKSPLSVVNTADEQGAGFAADAYARLNGAGAVCVTYGVGGLKLANSTAQAYAEKSPVVVISGAPGMKERRNEPLLHHKIRSFESQLNIFREVTVASAILGDPITAGAEIDRVLAAVIRHQRPGYLELPRDMLGVAIDERGPLPVPAPSNPENLAEALDVAVAMVTAARQPAIIAGEELARFGLHEELLTLMAVAGLPAASTTLSKSVVDESNPQYLGVYEGALGNLDVRDYIESSDCLLSLGANLSDATLGINTAHLDPSRTVAVTSERLSIRRSTYEDVRIDDFVRGLAARIPARPAPAIRNPARPLPWVPQPGTVVTTARLFQCLNAFLDSSTTVITDVGDALFGAIDLHVERSDFLAPAYYLSLGFAVPAAVGVQFARPAARPLVIVGDGAFQMTGMELTTVARYGLNPIVVVLNNEGYGTERPMLDGPFNDIHMWRFSAVPDLLDAGMGFDVRTEDELDAALRAARENTGSFSILDVHIARGDISAALTRLTTALATRVRQGGAGPAQPPTATGLAATASPSSDP